MWFVGGYEHGWGGLWHVWRGRVSGVKGCAWGVRVHTAPAISGSTRLRSLRVLRASGRWNPYQCSCFPWPWGTNTGPMLLPAWFWPLLTSHPHHPSPAASLPSCSPPSLSHPNYPTGCSLHHVIPSSKAGSTECSRSWPGLAATTLSQPEIAGVGAAAGGKTGKWWLQQWQMERVNGSGRELSWTWSQVPC